MSNWDCKDVEEKLRKKELVLLSQSGKSSVWKDMAIVAKPDETTGCENVSTRKLNYVACKKCLNCFKYDSHNTGTSHLSRHISKCNGTINSNTSGRQLKLTFPRRNVASQAKSEVLNAAVSVVVKDLRPFSVLEGRGMKEFAQTLIDIGAKHGKVAIDDVLPSRNTIASKVKSTASTQKSNLLSSLKMAVQDNCGFGVTADLWTDNYKKLTYLSSTVHWLKNEERKNSGLFCKLFAAERKTSDNIRNELVSNFAQIGIDESMLSHATFVTDRGANIKKALDCFSWLPCCCHVLNVILYHAFKMQPDNLPILAETHTGTVSEQLSECEEINQEGNEIDKVIKLLDSVKSLVAYLKRSGLASQLSTSVIQDIETRWNSKLAMLISVYEVFEEIQSILKEKNQNQKLQFIDVVLMKNLITLLAPFKSVSTAMEGDRYPTLHGVLLWKKSC